MPLTPESLAEKLRQAAPYRRLLVGYSGGLDSHVLLDLLVRGRDLLNTELLVLHADHGLQNPSADWARHCARICQAVQVPFRLLRLQIQRETGESLEAQAREARYRAFAEVMTPGDLLLTAHHQDDQAETLLLQLLRGSGVDGLAAMPELTGFACGRLLRPLLGYPRKALQAYAEAQRLDWIDDESNRDTAFDRNYLRHEILPLLQRRWPAAAATLARSAGHCAEAKDLIGELAGQDLQHLQREENTLSVSGLLQLSPTRRRALLRHWIRQSGFLPPNSRRLSEITGSLLTAAEDRMPLVRWQGAEVRRYRDRLYIMRPIQSPPPGVILEWDGEGEIGLPCGLGSLRLERADSGLSLARLHGRRLTIRFNPQGLRYQRGGTNHSASLKGLFQQAGVPPWERGRIPLLFADEELAAVGDLLVDGRFGGEPTEACVQPLWYR